MIQDRLCTHTFQIETIGNLFMLVSGCPEKNGLLHAAEIANTALLVRNKVDHLTIRHMPDRQLEIKIGLHTGPCSAGHNIGHLMLMFNLSVHNSYLDWDYWFDPVTFSYTNT